MSQVRYLVAFAAVGSACLFVTIANSQPSANKGKANPNPTFEPVADTKLLMEGLAGANMRGLAKLLKDKPTEAEAWNFARGQSLLLAETGNLLMMRPPRTQTAQETWMTHSTSLRDTATALARAAAAKDYSKARSALASVANVCNRCHQAFQVGARIDPFGE
jgi:hypothetical protein